MLSALLLLAVESTPMPRVIAVPYPEGVPLSGPHTPGPHVLYLNFDGATLTKGNCSSAPSNCTFLLSPATCDVPAYTNNVRKPLIIDLVKQYYSPFNVQVVTARPSQGPYSMVMISSGTGGQTCIGAPSGAQGIGPLDCGDTRDSDISFAFDFPSSNTMVAVHNIAVTIAQESAHAYGLGHTNDDTDIMYPVVSGVETAFLNKDMLICDYGPSFPQQCGPPPTSDCTGTGHQNSFQFLMDDMGPNPNQGPDMTPPSISFIAPHDGDTVASAFHVAFNASDNVGVTSVDLFLDGAKIGTEGSGFAWDIPGGTIPAGTHKLKGVASDMAGNTADSGEITVTVRALGDTPGDLGSACMTDADCPGGFCALNQATNHNFCTHVCDPMAADSCPMGFACVNAGGTNVCGPSSNSGGGCSCSISGRDELTGGSLAALLIFATCVLQRRRFRSR